MLETNRVAFSNLSLPSNLSAATIIGPPASLLQRPCDSISPPGSSWMISPLRILDHIGKLPCALEGNTFAGLRMWTWTSLGGHSLVNHSSALPFCLAWICHPHMYWLYHTFLVTAVQRRGPCLLSQSLFLQRAPP